jgi:hypothetical protein
MTLARLGRLWLSFVISFIKIVDSNGSKANPENKSKDRNISKVIYENPDKVEDDANYEQRESEQSTYTALKRTGKDENDDHLYSYLNEVHKARLLNRGVGSIKRFGGGTGFQGHFGILKRAPKKIFPEMLVTGGGGGGGKKFGPKLHVFDQSFLKNLEISKQKWHLLLI